MDHRAPPCTPGQCASWTTSLAYGDCFRTLPFVCVVAASGVPPSPALIAPPPLPPPVPSPPTTFPVIQVPSSCETTCLGLPDLFTGTCIQCLNDAGAVSSWSIPNTGKTCYGVDMPDYTWQCMRSLLSANGNNLTNASSLPRPPPLQRMPLYELNYTAMPALPLLNPTRFTQPKSNPTTVAWSNLLQTENFPYAPAAVQVCYPDAAAGNNATTCTTRPAGSSDGSIPVPGGYHVYIKCVQVCFEC